jgi:predicted  nucleic acid-binding Zn-ribbon protein
MSDPLLDLQDTDVVIMRLSTRQAALESGEIRRAAAFLLRDDENRLGELQLTLDALASDQKRLEYDIDALSQKSAAEEKRMYDGSVANAKELESMQHEVRREELEAQITEASAAVTAGRERLEGIERDSAAELVDIAAKLTEAASARERGAAMIDPDVLELYDDLRAQKKGVGAAALVDGVCQGCHEKLSAMEIEKLRKTTGVKRCEYCRRIIIL